jgi:hypothetical protein
VIPDTTLRPVLSPPPRRKWPISGLHGTLAASNAGGRGAGHVTVT